MFTTPPVSPFHWLHVRTPPPPLLLQTTRRCKLQLLARSRAVSGRGGPRGDVRITPDGDARVRPASASANLVLAPETLSGVVPAAARRISVANLAGSRGSVMDSELPRSPRPPGPGPRSGPAPALAGLRLQSASW
ncbi:hypothetical protein TgHK011_008138 [Trichoderma gracile]|nr:hypothetical protein TgHK011_008138 [Trichoderma gracile]